MSGISFPRQEGRSRNNTSPPAPGHPLQAQGCWCVGGPQLFTGQDTCQRCGRYPRQTIASTFAERAMQIARVAEGRRNRTARKKRRA